MSNAGSVVARDGTVEAGTLENSPLFRHTVAIGPDNGRGRGWFTPRQHSIGGVGRGRAKCRRDGIDLIVVRAIGEGAQLFYECIIPRCVEQGDPAVLTLRCKWVGPIWFAALFALTGDTISSQPAGEKARLEFTGASWILW
jgi:hypothetical protein